MKVHIKFSEGEEVRIRSFLNGAIPRVMEIRAYGPHPPEKQIELDWMVFELRLLANALAASKCRDKKRRVLDLSIKQRIDLEKCIKRIEQRLAQREVKVLDHAVGPEIVGNKMRPENWLEFELQLFRRIHVATK